MSITQEAPTAQESDPYLVPAVDRAVRLLTLLAQERHEVSLADLTRRLGLPHATVFRLAHTLERNGLLRRSATGYQIGPRILTLGFDYLAGQDLVALARPELMALRDTSGASANLAVLDGRETIYVCHVPSLRPLGSRAEVGSRWPAHASSVGRVLLSALSDQDLGALYRDATVEPFPDTATSLPDLCAQAAADRKRGWVLKHGVYERNLVAIAAPLFDAAGRVVAAINISGPAAAMQGGSVTEDKAAQVLEAAARISRQLGYRAPPPANPAHQGRNSSV